MFFFNGAVFANWVARVPAIKDAIDAGTGTLGVALLGIAVGSLLTMPFAGKLCERYTSRRVVVATGAAVAVSLASLALAPNTVSLAVLLALYGGSFGLLDVAMNVQAVAVVRRVGRPIMPWFHAAFSFGGLVGAGTGGLAAAAGLSPVAHFALAGAAAGALLLAVRRYLLLDQATPATTVPSTHSIQDQPLDGPAQCAHLLPATDPDVVPHPPASHSTASVHRRRRLRRPRIPLLVVGLGAIACCAAIGEGAMADWSALFLRDVRGLDAGAAALGYAAFSITMTAGRVGGEAAIRRLGSVGVLRLGGLAAASGILLAVVVPSAVAGVVGFGLVGLGMCCAFPLALTTAGESSNGSGGDEIATVSVIGYLGFLVGPPLIGLLAEVVELRGAILAVALPSVGLALLAPVVDRAAARARPEAVPEPVPVG
ncbi:MAG: MFS transporter [Acidimicrobiales bacterium]